MPLYNPQNTTPDRYRGSDHTTVVNPEAGDYTLETGKINWFYDGTSWARRTPVHWGLLYPADSFAEAFTTLSGSSALMLPAIPGDLVAYTADRGQAGNLTYTGRYNGTTWENISGVDSTENIYRLDQAVNTVNSRVTTEVETLNDSIGSLVIPPDYYAGQGVKTTDIGTPFAGMYTTELDRLWTFNGTAWGQTPYLTDTYVAIGTSAGLEGLGINSVAIGFNSNAPGHYSVAVGDSASANAVASVAVGDQTLASGACGIAIGEAARAELEANTIAIGNTAVASGVGSLAIGTSVTVSGTGSVGIGLYNPTGTLTVPGNENFFFGWGLNTTTTTTKTVIFGDTVNCTGINHYNAIFGATHIILDGVHRSLVAGELHTVTAPDCVATGYGAIAHIQGCRVHADKTIVWNAQGDNHSLQVLLKGYTTDDTPYILRAGTVAQTLTEKTQLTPYAGGVILFKGLVDAYCPADNTKGASWEVSGRVSNGGTLQFQTVIPLWNPDNLSLTITSDPALSCARFTFTGLAATAFKILASLDCVEIR